MPHTFSARLRIDGVTHYAARSLVIQETVESWASADPTLTSIGSLRSAAIQSTHNTPQTRPSVVLVKKEKG